MDHSLGKGGLANLNGIFQAYVVLTLWRCCPVFPSLAPDLDSCDYEPVESHSLLPGFLFSPCTPASPKRRNWSNSTWKACQQGRGWGTHMYRWTSDSWGHVSANLKEQLLWKLKHKTEWFYFNLKLIFSVLPCFFHDTMGVTVYYI